jgi:hypothetical protein
VARELPAGRIPEAKDVAAEMTWRWLGHRDWLIDNWSHRTLASVPEARLARMTQKVWEYAVDHGFQWEQPDDEEPEWTACALACLRWWYQECAGRTPVPALSLDELQAWLDAHAYPVHKNEKQMSLMASMV